MFSKKMPYLYLSIFIAACCAVLFGSTFFAEKVYLDPESLSPMRYPQALLGLMFLLAMLFPLARKEFVDIPNLKQVAPSIMALAGGMALFALSLRYLGFLLSSSLMLFIVFRVLRYATVVKSTVMAILFTGICWYAFSTLARVSLPIGILTNY